MGAMSAPRMMSPVHLPGSQPICVRAQKAQMNTGTW